jgi:crossover junction endodeoxyribonuclease RuvC
MKVLAIDPGFGRCGIAVLTKENGRERVIFSTCVETPGTETFSVRLTRVANQCAQTIEEHAPNTLALERLYFNSNQKTAMQVAEVRGALLYVAARAGLSVAEYTPGQVKAAVTGWGRSDKQAVAHMLTKLLGITKHIAHDDEFDAIAIGVTHLAHTR